MRIATAAHELHGHETSLKESLSNTAACLPNPSASCWHKVPIQICSRLLVAAGAALAHKLRACDLFDTCWASHSDWPLYPRQQ
jgi:hypothetical protein